MSHQTSQLVILFADISQSTRLFEIQGDVQARQIIGRALEMLSRVTDAHGGRVIKTIGDEVMVTFPHVDKAVEAACEMHRVIRQDLMFSWVNLAIRVGLHFGEVLVENGDVYGDAVNVAAKVVSMAQADQVLTTRSTIDSLSAPETLVWRPLGQARIPGKKQPVELVEVIWQEDTANLTKPLRLDSIPDLEAPVKLVISYRGREIELNQHRPSLYLGRDPHNDLVITEALVSRKHAHIEFRQGKFLLVDHSTNGTYVYVGDDRFFVHREEILLHDEGKICPGQDAPEDSRVAMHYRCIQKQESKKSKANE